MADIDKPIPVELEYAEVDLSAETTPADDAPPIGDYEHACVVCGVELTYAGRGRKPKYCAEHKPTAAKSPSRVTSAKGRWQEPLAQALNSQFAVIGMGVYAFNQFDGTCILNGSGQLSTSLVAVAETNPRVRRTLENMVQTGAWAGVAMAAASIVLPIMANHNIIPQLPMFAGATA